MQENKIALSWNKVTPNDAAKQRMLMKVYTANQTENSVKKGESKMKKKQKWTIQRTVLAVVCFAIVALAAYTFRPSDFLLPHSDKNIKVRYELFAPILVAQSDACFVYQDENELFAPMQTEQEQVIFEGTVIKVQNIVVSFDSISPIYQEYRAIASIQIDEVLRGDLQTGEIIEVLLPAPVNPLSDGTSVFSSIASISPMMTVGTKGIFAPIRYNEQSIWSENGVTLYLIDLSEYGFMNGTHYIFLEKDGELLFDSSAYPSFSEAQTLEDVKQIIRNKFLN